MLFKLDENIPRDVIAVLAPHGHRADTVVDEGLGGRPDPVVMDTCRAEGRAVITLDVGLGNIKAYPPHNFAGIIVLRLRSQSRDAVVSIVTGLVPLLDREELTGKLWIVDETSVRVRAGGEAP